MPMMPMEPANAQQVRVFLRNRLLKLSARAVSGMKKRPIFVHRRHLERGIIRRKRCGVRLNHAVPQADVDAGSILLCKPGLRP